jgi:hypothetical protein
MPASCLTNPAGVWLNAMHVRTVDQKRFVKTRAPLAKAGGFLLNPLRVMIGVTPLLLALFLTHSELPPTSIGRPG